jgi:hypothetical protein
MFRTDKTQTFEKLQSSRLPPRYPANLVAYVKRSTTPTTQAVLRTANPSARSKNERRRTFALPRRPRHGRGFLFCRALTVANPVPLVANMYSKKKDSMTIQISVLMWHKKTETKALLDSGATHNFIDKRAIHSLGLGTRSLPHPLQVNNVNGSLNQEGSITQYCNLWIRQGGQSSKAGFLCRKPRKRSHHTWPPMVQNLQSLHRLEHQLSKRGRLQY